MFDQPLVFVDLETTGTDPVRDRVIEIGIAKVSDGEIEREWQSLVDPQQPIPPMIQSITGISDDMVRGAPSFAAVAEEVEKLLGDALFIAHNARFDVGFLRHEFLRLGRKFQPTVLCTVKFSRALYPQHHRHGLDALIARHGLTCAARHRALGDACVLWEFVQLVRREHAPEVIEQALTKAMRTPRLPPQLPPGSLESLPEAPGVYLFYGEDDRPLYIAGSANLRNHVRAHFIGDHKAGRAARIAKEIRRIDWIETGGELGAQLLEARLVKEKMPIHNRRLARPEEQCGWRIRESAHAVPAVELVRACDIDPRQLAQLHGLFRSQREAVTSLREIATAYQLCPQRLGLECGGGSCSAAQLKKCKGVCTGREAPHSHDMRLCAALSSLRLNAWPYRGRIAIRESDSQRDRENFHVFDAWCHIGTESTLGDLYDAAETNFEAVFDLDIYKILTRYLAREPSGIIELETAAAA